MVLDDESTVGAEDVPSVVPGYEILGVLGQGGMGAVYLARQLDSGQLVALKRLTTSLARANLERFRREAQVLQALDVPGVVRVLDSGVEATQPWFAMEWVKGPSLADVLDRNPEIPPDESVRIVQQVARTVAELHRRGLVHRDLKPSNIVLRTDGRPVLVDFGLTRHVDPDAHTAYTRRPIGTPAYMAPELLKGTDVDWVRADIYALGATLARCILGRNPQGSWDLGGAPAHLRPALEGALHAQPDLRFETADAFADALAARPTRARSWPVVIAGAGLLGAMAGALALWPSTPSAPQVAPLLEAYGERLREGSDEAEQVFARVLDDADAELIGPLWVERARMHDTADAWAAAWSHAGAADRPEVMGQLADALWRDGDFEALDVLLSTHRDQLQAGPRLDRMAMEVELYQRRFEGALETADPAARRLIEPFLERRPHHDVDDLPKKHGRLWTCDKTTCVTADGERYDHGTHARFMVGDGRLVAWSRGQVRAVEGQERCEVPDTLEPYVSTFFDGRYVLASKGRNAGVHQLDLATCELERHPDQPSWSGSFVNKVMPWDADGDGVEELVVFVGPPYAYEVRLYDTQDRLLSALRLGNPRPGTVWNGDLVLATHPPHGNGEAFDLPPIGMHRVVYGDGALKIAQTWPGLWRGTEAADLDGDGVQTLIATDHRNVAWLFDGEEPPVRMRSIFGVRALQLDDDPAEELAVQTLDAGVFIVGDGTAAMPVAHNRPARLEPTGDPDVDRALELDAMGLSDVAAEQLAAAAFHRPSREAPWSTLAVLQDRAGRTQAAIDAWTRAAREGDGEAYDLALETALREGAIDAARALADELGEPSSPEHRSALATRTFDFATSPADWEVRRPLALWNSDRQRLRIHGMGGAGVVAGVALERTSRFAGVRIELTIDQLEFASDLWLRLGTGDGPYVRIHAPGSQQRILRAVTPHQWEFGDVVDNDPFGPHHSTLVLALDGDQGVFRQRLPSGEERRMRFDKPVPEATEFVVELTGPPGTMLDVSLEEVTFWGLEPRAGVDLGPRSAGFERAVRNTELRTSPALGLVAPDDDAMLAAIYQSYGSAWRMHRSASRLGERLLGLPGFGTPELLRAHRGLALVRADALLARGEPGSALEVLQTTGATPPTCLEHHLLELAAQRALHDEAGAQRAREALDACEATPSRVRAEAWSLGVDLP